MPDTAILSTAERAFAAAARTATLATIAPDGRPRLVPICFVVGADDAAGRPRLYTALDEKPKRVDDPRDLARVRDLVVTPGVSLLVDRWSEDWSRLGWVRLYGQGVLLEPEPHQREEHGLAVSALRAKYPQYGNHDLDARPVIRMTIERAVSWGDLTPD